MRAEDRIAAIEEFMRYAFEEWPKQREHLVGQIANRCTNCILSENYTSIVDGLCAECRSYQADADGHSDDQDIAGMEKELDDLLKNCEGKAEGKYDALVMFSGGKDSTIILHQLRTRYQGLRLLALMVDNGFTSSIGLANVRRVSNILDDVDHLIIKPKANLFKNTFRYALTHLNDGGCYSSVDRLGGDLAFDIGRNTAASFGIPLVIHGGTRAQLHKILKLYSYKTSRTSEKERRDTTGGFTLSDIYDEEEMKYWWDGSAWPDDKIPRVVFPLYVWQYDEQAMRREVIRLGLIEEGHDNPIVSNYDLLPVNFAVDVYHLGYSGYEPEFSQLVREQKTDRHFWLYLFESIEYLTKQGTLLRECIDDTLHKLALTREEVGLP